jgi:hypothetical protein
VDWAVADESMYAVRGRLEVRRRSNCLEIARILGVGE